MHELITAIMVCIAIQNGSIVAVKTVPFPSFKQCTDKLGQARAEPDPQGYTFRIECIGAGGDQT